MSIAHFISARWVALLTACCLLLMCVSCGEKPDDDKDMTRSVVEQYLDAFGQYNIARMNQVSLTRFAAYDDSAEVNAACKLLTSRTTRTVEGITVSGNAAIAQISIAAPEDYQTICREALDSAMLQIEQDTSEKPPAEILRLSIKKTVGQADRIPSTAEITLSKVNNKWYIVRSQDIADLMSEIRTAVVSVYTVIED